MSIIINGTTGISGVDGTAGSPALQGNDTNTGVVFGTDTVGVVTGGVQRTTVDSSGRLLVGTSTSASAGIAQYARLQVVGNSLNDTTSIFSLQRNEAFGDITSGEELGAIFFADRTGNPFAQIVGACDGTTSAGDFPGRLTFSTTADGTSSPTERMRIRSDGSVLLSSDANAQQLFVDNTNASLSNAIIYADSSRAANSTYFFFAGSSSNNTDNEFVLRGDGNGFCDGAWIGGGADYAEYFEWSDSNSAKEDRRGISVVLDGNKIRKAVTGEDPIGVISGNPSVVGDAAWNKWDNKYLRDEFGTYIQEDYEVEDEDGNIVVQQRRKLNPAYDPDVEYISREQRPEWNCVGLMGKLRIRKGQVTGSRWIKMRDISDSVEEWLVR